MGARFTPKPLQALTWELWRRARMAGSVSFALLALCVAWNFLLRPEFTGWTPRAVLFVIGMVMSLALVFAMFHSTEFQPGKEWHGFPYRWFVLPVPTAMLVACPMLLGLITIELMELFWARLVFAPVGIQVPGWMGLILGSGLLSFQAVLWSLAGFRVTRIVALSVVALLLVNLSFLLMSPDLAPHVSRPAVMGAAIGLGFAALIGAWFSVERQRRGGGRGRGWIKMICVRMIDRAPRRRRRFASASGAQLWYEWRRAGWILPASTGCGLLLVFLPVAWFLRSDADAVFWILGWAIALPILLAAVIGKGFIKPEPWSSNLEVPQFLCVRPMPNGDLVVSKLKAAALSTIASWFLTLAFLAFWLMFLANTRELAEALASWKAAQAAAPIAAGGLLLCLGPLLTWRCLVGGLWVGLAGSSKKYFAALTGQAAALVLAIWIIVSLSVHYRKEYLGAYVTWIGWGLMAAILLKFWGAVAAWRDITPKRMATYVFCWAAATALLILLVSLACPNIFWLKHLLLLAALLPMPLARLGLAPRSLAKNRHRL